MLQANAGNGPSKPRPSGGGMKGTGPIILGTEEAEPQNDSGCC